MTSVYEPDQSVRLPERGRCDRTTVDAILDEADKTWPVWAGVIPLRVEALPPVPAEDFSASLPDFDVTRLERR